MFNTIKFAINSISPTAANLFTQRTYIRENEVGVGYINLGERIPMYTLSFRLNNGFLEIIGADENGNGLDEVEKTVKTFFQENLSCEVESVQKLCQLILQEIVQSESVNKLSHP